MVENVQAAGAAMLAKLWGGGGTFSSMKEEQQPVTSELY